MIESPTKPFALSEDEIDTLAALTKAGVSAQRIAYTLGVSPRTVFRYRDRLKITRPRYMPLTDGEKQRAQQLLDEGASYAEVARTIGRSPHAVKRAFPGRAWTRQQMQEYINTSRKFRGLL